MTLPMILRHVACFFIGHDVRVGHSRLDPTPFKCARCKTLFEDIHGTWKWKEGP